MKIDLYVKVCLTVIAVSLSTIAFKNFAKPAYAEITNDDILSHILDLKSNQKKILDNIEFNYQISKFISSKLD